MRFMLANEVGAEDEIDTLQMDLSSPKIITCYILFLAYMYFILWI